MKSTYKQGFQRMCLVLMPARLNPSHTFLTRWGIHSLQLCMCCAIPEISSASVCVRGQRVRAKRGKPMLGGPNIGPQGAVRMGWVYVLSALCKTDYSSTACLSQLGNKKNIWGIKQTINNRKKETDFNAMEKTEIDCKSLFLFQVILHTQYMWP